MFLLLVHLPICVSFVVCKLVLVWDRENRINKTQSVKWIPYDACIPLSGFSFPFLSWFVFYCLFVRSSLLQLNIGGNAKLATVPKAFDNQLISDFRAKAVLGEVHTKFIWRKKKNKLQVYRLCVRMWRRAKEKGMHEDERVKNWYTLSHSFHKSKGYICGVCYVIYVIAPEKCITASKKAKRNSSIISTALKVNTDNSQCKENTHILFTSLLICVFNVSFLVTSCLFCNK